MTLSLNNVYNVEKKKKNWIKTKTKNNLIFNFIINFIPSQELFSLFYIYIHI